MKNKFINWEVIGILILVIGGTVGAISYFAKAKDVELVEYRLEQKIQDDRFSNIQRRIWALTDRYGDMCRNAPPEIKKEYRELVIELEKLKKERAKKGER